MPKTLEDYISESHDIDLKGALGELVSAIRNQQEKEFRTLTDKMGQEIRDDIAKIAQSVKQVLMRPDPQFPKIPEVKFPEKMAMDKPTWYSEPQLIDHEAISSAVNARMTKHMDALLERMGNNHAATSAMMLDILNKEPEEKITETATDKKQIGSGIGSIRRHSRWQIATYPQLPGTGKIISAGDGVTFFLPAGVQVNSETCRLNGGLPLSQGVDYTITGNKVVFSQDQTNSVQEWRYQN